VLSLPAIRPDAVGDRVRDAGGSAFSGHTSSPASQTAVRHPRRPRQLATDELLNTPLREAFAAGVFWRCLLHGYVGMALLESQYAMDQRRLVALVRIRRMSARRGRLLLPQPRGVASAPAPAPPHLVRLWRGLHGYTWRTPPGM
jgi:hypothetical protein